MRLNNIAKSAAVWGAAFHLVTWTAAMTLSILSIVYLRLAHHPQKPASDWIRLQKEQVTAALEQSRIRFLCVHDMAFDLEPQIKAFPTLPEEDHIIFASAAAKRGCRLPEIPTFASATAVLVAVSPKNGYGASLYTADDLSQFEKGLERTGWRKTGGTTRQVGENARQLAKLYYRPGAWLFVVPLDLHQIDKQGVLLAGRWDPKSMALK